MAEMGGDSDDSSWWFGTTDREAARSLTNCQCGFNATYKDRKDAKSYLKLKYMHSYWCPEYMDKAEYERRYGEQKES